MKIKNIIMSLMCCGIFLSCFQFENCEAMSVCEQYSCCFEEKDSSNIVIQKTSEEDKEILRTLILSEDADFARYLGNGFELPELDKFLLEKKDNLSLTIKNLDNNVVGQILISKGSNVHQLNVCYWIGSKFRGNGYAHLAVSKAMSKIWKLDRAVSFEFVILDKNIASIRTLEKICTNLNIDFKSAESFGFIKKNHLTIEMKAIKIGDKASDYNLQIYINNILVSCNVIEKEKLLETYSEDKIESGTLVKSLNSMYSIKYLD